MNTLPQSMTHPSSQLTLRKPQPKFRIIKIGEMNLCAPEVKRDLWELCLSSHSKPAESFELHGLAFPFLQFPLMPLGRPSFVFWLNLLIYIYLLDFFSSQTLGSISGQQWHRKIIMAAWPLNRGKFPLLLLLHKQKTTNYPEVHKGIKLNWKLKIHLDEFCLNALSQQLNTSGFQFYKHWNKSLMFHLIFFFALSSGDHVGVPIPALALRLHQWPAEHPAALLEEHLCPAGSSSHLQNSWGCCRGGGRTPGEGTESPLLGWGQRQNHLHPSSTPQNLTGSEFSLLLAQRGGRKFNFFRKMLL